MVRTLKQLVYPIARRIVDIGEADYETNEHIRHFRRCIEFIGCNGIHGDLLEFGVGRGSTLAIINKIGLKVLRGERDLDYRLFGFDSFDGLPEPQGRDRDVHTEDASAVRFEKGDFRSTKDEVWSYLEKKDFELGNIELVAGWYDQTLTEDLKDSLGIKAASLINIDCDFYSSTKVALGWCESLIQQGTIVSFDDWFCYKGSKSHGENCAFTEFLESNPHLTAQEFSSYSWHGKAFIMSRDDSF